MCEVALAEARVARIVRAAVWHLQATEDEVELVRAAARRFPSRLAFGIDDHRLAAGFLEVIRREA